MVKDQIVKILEKATQLRQARLPAGQGFAGQENIQVDVPENSEFGDYSTNIAMILAKKKSKNPRELAEKIVSKLATKPLFEKIEVAGAGFINFWLKFDVLINSLIEIERSKENFGRSNLLKGKKYLVEHTSPNPNKALHLGHLRNNVTAMAIANLFEFIDAEVVLDCVDNNRGIAIAKLIWGYLKFARKDGKQSSDLDDWFTHQKEWQTPADLGVRPDRFVDKFYVKGAEDFENPGIELKVRQLVIDWEAEDPKTWALWKKVLHYSYQGQELTLKRLGNRWDKVWHEHEHYKAGKNLVEVGLKKGIFKKLSDGAVVTDLSKYKLPDTIVIKSDGTALYITQDLALTKLKKETFKADKLFWVIGPEQSLAMQQMFAVCVQLGIGKLSDFVHLAYGYMSIKGQGKMSSRLGNVVYIDDLLDLAKRKIMEKYQSEESLAEKIAVGAVKYSILKVGRMQDIAFDINESVSVEGNSGPYLQYTFARTQSVLQKANSVKCTANSRLAIKQINHEEELVLRCLVHFPEVIADSAESFAPNLLCNYLYELASKFNTFYNKHRILGTTREVEHFRICLTKAIGIVIKNGLNLLGIKSPERM